MTEETLEEFLIRNKDRIEYVSLEWTWPEMKVVESNRCVIMKDRGQLVPCSIYLGFNATVVDWEYSFLGTWEQALEFSRNYSIWDERMEDSMISEFVLESEHEGDNFDYHYHPDELDPNDAKIIHLDYLGLYSWAHSRDGNNIAGVWSDDVIMTWEEWHKDHDYGGRENEP